MAEKIYELFGGEAYAWIEQESSIHLKIAAANGDPVELSWNDARNLARLLVNLADEGEALDT
jgi:hypothetical protein